MTTRRGLWLSLAVVALSLLVGRAIAGAYADYRWYEAIGASDAWSLAFDSLLQLRVLAFLFAGIFAFVNLWGVRHSVVSLVLPRRIGDIEIGEEVPSWLLMSIVIALAVLVGVAFAIPATDWQGFVLALRGTRFGEADPYFGMDTGFFVYWVPFERSVYTWVVGVVGIVSISVVSLYALTPSLRWEHGRFHVSTYVRRHVSLIGGIALALLAWSFRLDAFGALAHGTGPDGAFGAFDHKLGVPVSLILAYAAIGSSFVVAWAGWTGQTRIALAVMTGVILLAPTMEYLLPLGVQWASAPVDPALRDVAYRGDRDGFTRTAYGLDQVLTRPFAASDGWATAREAASVSVWDPVPLARAIERTRRRGPIVGGPVLLPSPAGPVLASVERPSGTAETSPGGWTIVRSLAAVTDENGGVVRVDQQGRYPIEDQSIGAILFYDGARGSLLITDSVRQPAAPLLESFGSRLAEAWSQQNFRLLNAPKTGARMVRLRDVHERVRAIVPFFSQGTRILPVIHGDSLMWSLELYSSTDEYPLARRMKLRDGPVNYVRHAGTALVHAHTGRVTIIPDERPDPIAQTWMRELPVTLQRPTLAPSLIASLPPDVDGAEVQARAFAMVGVRNEVMIGRHIPASDGADSLLRSDAQTFVWLPSAGVSAWLVPIIDDRERVAGVLVAPGGGDRSLRWLPVLDTTFNWSGLLERLQRATVDENNDRTTSRLLGRVRLLPLVDGHLLALQPVYGWPVDGPPFLSSVAMAMGDTARAAPSTAALVGAPVSHGPAPTTLDAKQERMRVLYGEMRAALEKGDWKKFGGAFEELGVLLGRR